MISPRSFVGMLALVGLAASACSGGKAAPDAATPAMNAAGTGGTSGAGDAGSRGGGGSEPCANNSDPVQSFCANGVLTSIDHCAETRTVCAFGCHDTAIMFTAACDDPPDAGPDGSTGGTVGRDGGVGAGGEGGGGAAGTVAPDAGSDAPLGTFVMCDDHADFNGRGRCAATGKVGAVLATQTRTSGGASTTLTAIFGTTTPPSIAGCASEAFGAACAVVTCPRTTPASAATVTAAGVITAKSNGGALATTPDAKGRYDVATLGRALWSMPKAAVAFSAAGGATSMFGETFCGPAGTMMTKPAGAPTAALTIDRAADLALAWTPAAVGDVELVARDEAAPAIVELHCSFTGSAGQGVVPKAALAKISAGAHALSSRLWVRKIGIAKDGTCTELTAITTNDSSTAGAPFDGPATFQ